MTSHELLADLERLGITIEARGDRLRYSPISAVTPELIDRLKSHKAELLAMMLPTPLAALTPPVAISAAPVEPTKAFCRCGSATWRDVPIHGGVSLRRDCGRCGRFLDFPVWYAKDVGQNVQQAKR